MANVKVAWSKPADTEFALGFNVYQDNVKANCVAIPADALDFTIQNVPVGMYTYSAVAFNVLGEGPQSQPISVGVPAGVPSVLVNVTVSVTVN